MSDSRPLSKDPLHGVTLAAILEDLVARRGFEDLGRQIRIRCFTHDPSIKSSLKFLRRTPWARAKVEALYVRDRQAKPQPPIAERPVAQPAAEVSSGYLDRLMRRESFQALWPLFAHAEHPAKEMTESFSALDHLRPHMPKEGPFRVIHVGDGAHARTAALFALKTKGENISVDPIIHEARVSQWQERFSVERFAWRKSRIEDVIEELEALPPMPVFVTFVHAHVNVDVVLSRLRWDAAFTLLCCVPGKQRSQAHREVAAGEDRCVLSPDRQFQVLLPAAASA